MVGDSLLLIGAPQLYLLIMLAKITSFWDDFVDILFPGVCPACGELLTGSEAYLCTSCLISLPRLGSSGLSAPLVDLKFAGFPEVKSVRSFFVYQPKGRVQALLKSLKYDDNKALGVFLGRLWATESRLDKELSSADLIVPVPLHPRRQRERGYNQSACFCEGFSEVSGIPYDASFLQRNIYTLSQTRKTKSERIAAMQGVFSLRPGADPSGLRILLVDDVLTTGATLEGCVEVLVKNGCKSIFITTIAAAQS